MTKDQARSEMRFAGALRGEERMWVRKPRDLCYEAQQGPDVGCRCSLERQ